MLEVLDARVVPSAYYWLGGLAGGWSTPGNWTLDPVNHTPAASPPRGMLDDVYFDGSVSSLGVSGAGGFSGYKSLHLVNGYSGTVAVSSLSVQTLELTSGTLDPLSASDTLMASVNFTWTGGTINDTGFNATIVVNGGGTITPPVGGALSLGSTLNFGSSDGTEKTTTIGGEGDIDVTGPGDYVMRVNDKAKVVTEVTQQNNAKGFKGLNSTKKLLALSAGGKFGYVGEGSRTEEFRVENTGGLFYIGGGSSKNITLTLTDGNANSVAYLQKDSANAEFQLYSSCTLDASAGKGVTINSGNLFIMGNANVTAQVATIKGDFTFAGGSIGFPSRINVQDENGNLVPTWLTFEVVGDVTWSGGDFAPGVDGSGGNAGNQGKQDNADNWLITDTFTTDRTQTAKPTIKPTALNVPQNQQAKGTWYIIEYVSTAGGNPDGGNGFTVNQDAEKNSFTVTK